MYCRICGDVNGLAYRNRSRMTLCESCHQDTPAKADRDEFERVYWEGKAEEVPLGIRREFYEDYKASQYGPVKAYRAATTEPA